MAKQSLTTIFPFLVVTLVCVGWVELFYRGVEKNLLEAVVIEQKTIETGDVKTTASKSPPVATDVDYSIITRRNLFGPPPSATDDAATSSPVIEEELEATALDVVLMGTVGGEEGNERAIILKKKDRSQDLYQVGQIIEGAVIKEIKRGRVILTVDGRDEMLDISEARQFANNVSPPVAATSGLRRRPVVVAPQANAEIAEPASPRVVRPLRRIVRPRAAIVAEQTEQGVPPEDVEQPSEMEAEQTLPENEAVSSEDMERSENEEAVTQ